MEFEDFMVILSQARVMYAAISGEIPMPAAYALLLYLTVEHDAPVEALDVIWEALEEPFKKLFVSPDKVREVIAEYKYAGAATD